jgi:hypothetical protein
MFLEMFWHNLLDIEVDPTPYDTHSFCRDGCQYFALEKRWNIQKF